ncbi:class I SAM-dependent methyltransferase [Pedobacter nyackensis]|uniref:class I SAM-dependent methyltransferase n=1 Tax=Pedobacter nyackensis TaxID=475255 RepID=UPI00292DC899|nr:class I SAM-dependent methyltransferase [Pedobacter nyackensis]
MNSTLVSSEIDVQKVEAFLGRVITDFGAALGVSLAFIGDKLGLYKAMAHAGPLSSEEVAERSGTSERYVREWLINQAAGGYIEYDAKARKYILPDEHAVALTDEESPFYVAGGFQIINGLTKAEDRIKSNFLKGGGMKWGEHHHDLFDGTERFFKPSYLGNLMTSWLPAINGIVNKLESGIAVADLGCGHGVSTILMAEAFPSSHFFGFDNHEPSIKKARAHAKEKKLKNVTFQASGAADFNGQQYDFITFFDCLHDMGDPTGVLKHCKKMLRKDGVIMAVEPMAGRKTEENFNPVGRVYSGASVLCCTPNALATGGFALGTVAADEELEKVARNGGFKHFKRATETPFNRVFEIRD